MGLPLLALDHVGLCCRGAGKVSHHGDQPLRLKLQPFLVLLPIRLRLPRGSGWGARLSLPRGVLYLDRGMGTAAEHQKEFSKTFKWDAHRYVRPAQWLAAPGTDRTDGDRGAQGADAIALLVAFTAMTGACGPLLAGRSASCSARENPAYPNAARVLSAGFRTGRGALGIVTCRLGERSPASHRSPSSSSAAGVGPVPLTGIFGRRRFGSGFPDDPPTPGGGPQVPAVQVRSRQGKGHAAIVGPGLPDPSLWILAGIIVGASFASYFLVQQKYLARPATGEDLAEVLTSIVPGGSAIRTIGGWVADGSANFHQSRSGGGAGNDTQLSRSSVPGPSALLQKTGARCSYLLLVLLLDARAGGAASVSRTAHRLPVRAMNMLGSLGAVAASISWCVRRLEGAAAAGRAAWTACSPSSSWCCWPPSAGAAIELCPWKRAVRFPEGKKVAAPPVRR